MLEPKFEMRIKYLRGPGVFFLNPLILANASESGMDDFILKSDAV